MTRTKNRPIVTGKILPYHALQFGALLTLLGIFTLYTKINILTSFLSLLTAFTYVVVYTPMKRISWFNTTIGAFPGALPPLGGWAAATGTLNFDAGVLFMILFLWQHPHFYAIAWMFKDDYARGGFKMLPCIESDGKRTFSQVRYYSYILLPVSLIPFFSGLSGWYYCIGTLLAGVGLLYFSEMFIKTHSKLDARNLLRATVIYLPILLLLIIVDVNF